jgi:molybdate transport system regulatory protein
MTKTLRATARTRIRIVYGEEFAIGPGKADLLEAIAESGSISAGARQLDMSYRRAWLLIDEMNRCFRQPVVGTATGGKGGGGAQITEFGLAALKEFRALEQRVRTVVEKSLPSFNRMLGAAKTRSARQR